MLTGKAIYNRIDEIIEHAYMGFLFDLVGDDFFTDIQKRQIEGLGLIIGRKPLLELLYILIRNRPTEGYRQDYTLNMLLDQVASTGILPIINDTQQGTLDNGIVAMMNSVEDAKQALKKQVKQQIVEINKQVKQNKAVSRYTSIPNEEEKNRSYLPILLAGMALIAPQIQKLFTLSFTTELTNFINDATIDHVAEEALLTGTLPTEAQVYKKVINDHSLCEWCNKFYTRNGQPIVYKLSELQANGSNYGKPKSQWKPVLGATHPRCRCQLHLIRI